LRVTRETTVETTQMSLKLRPNWLLDLPIKKKLYLIIGLLIANIVLIISLGIFALNTLSAIRASVAAEDLWAKGQKTAIYSLAKYALTQDERAYQQYLEALKVPIALEKANRELKKPKPDLRILDQAFIEGGSHPADVRGIGLLFTRFQRAPHVASAFATWAQGQELIHEMQRIGEQLHAHHLAGKGSKEDASRVVGEIESLGRRLTALEIHFSNELGEASRWAAKFFLFLMIGGSLVIGLLSVATAFYISREIVTGIAKISQAASEAAQGNLNVRVAVRSKDELGKLANAFNHMTEGLGKLDKLKTEFFANISHEFRTPLTLMIGPLEDSLDDELHPLTSEQRARQELALRNALRLLKLVNSLLDFSRIEAGRMQAVFEPTDLAQLTQELASHFESLMQKAALKFTVTAPKLDQPVYVDRELWEKIVLNLLSNAFKFTLKGEVALELRAAGEFVELVVKDSGIAIDEKELPNIFKRFYRVEGARGRTFEGTGIGLALIQELAKMHGGSITVTSKINEGSTFTVRIPFGSAHLPQNQLGGKRQASPTKIRAEAFAEEALRWLPVGTGEAKKGTPVTTERASARILLADDNADMRSYVENLLMPHWHVTSVGDGQDAYDELLRGDYDLVLSDVMMPRLDGFGLLRKIRENPAIKMISVILISARAGDEAKVAGVQSGANDYLVKPFSAKELVARVRTHLELKRLRDERLKLSEESLKIALASAQMGAWDWDIKTNQVTSDDVTQKLFGALPGTLSDQRDAFEKSIHPEDREQTLSLITESVKDRSLFDAEFRVIWSDGTQCWIRSVGRALYDDLGRPYRMLGIVLDTTKHKKDEEVLKNAIRARDEFITIASHELKTPITSLKMQLQITKRDVKPEEGSVPPADQLLKSIDFSIFQVDRLTKLIEDMLDATRMQNEKPILELTTVNLAKVIHYVLDRFSGELSSVNCQTEVKIPQEITGQWDAARIEQALANLVSNAIKYAPDSNIKVSASKDRSQATLVIQDTGPGIPKEKQSLIFERFERATPYRKISGFGLGLYISQQIIEAHGGSIHLNSEVGRGTTFTVKLPIYDQAPSAIPTS